jgi:hypothetical protein
MKEPAIVASVLGADHAKLGRVVAESEAAGVDRVQWNIMDGRFVPNLCFGADVVAPCRGSAVLPFEAHLMVEDPDPWLQPFADAGCDPVPVHAEACRQLHRTVSGIRSLGVRSGVALTPATPLERVRHVLDQVDVVRRLIERTGLPTLIEVDGPCRPRPRRARCGPERSRWWRVRPSSRIPREGRRRWPSCAAPSPTFRRPGGEGGALTGMQRQRGGVATGADEAWTK